MNILESQVSDLAYLVNSPIRVSHDSEHRIASSAESPAGGTNLNTMSGTKRKGDGEGDGDGTHANADGTPGTRAKRNRYISIACNECKRRKIKCNGNTPCQRCGNLNLECQYAPNCCSNGFRESEEFRQMNSQINHLQEQVNTLFANLNSMRNRDVSTFPPVSESAVSTPHSNAQLPPPIRHRAPAKHPSFRGPTSSAFSLDVAKNTLHSMGYQQLDETMAPDSASVGSPPALEEIPSQGGIRGRDVLLEFSKEEVVRLCRVYEEEMGMMYPVLDIEDIILHTNNVYTWMDAVYKNGLVQNKSFCSQGILDGKTCVLKMVVAISMILEGNGQSEMGYRLFESVREKADRALHSEVVDIKSLPFLVLVSIYHFHCDEEALAWRIIGQVARMCIELGIHRRDSLFRLVKDEQERSSVSKLFWSIYVLDRRWSFGTGMPFALQDTDIDPNLPEPEMAIPYLNVMITFSRIGSKVWKSISTYSPTLSPSLNVEEIGYLDYQILQWQKSIPLELQLPTASIPQTSSRAMHRLQILLYLRANQMRILIYRRVLHSANSIQDNLNYATVVVELAKDTIQALTHLNQTTDIYRAQQVCFNYFLVSALAVIFLASCHAPVHFSAICRDEFYMALDLVKGFSTKSWVSKRLWRTIKGLREIGPKLGLSHGNLNGASNDMEDPHSSAALTMAGLAGHEISSLAHFHTPMTGSSNSPRDGFQMSNEMTNLFEMALGSAGMNGNGTSSAGGYGALSEGDSLNGIGPTVFGRDEELYKQLRDLF